MSIGPEDTLVADRLHSEPPPRPMLATLAGEPFLPAGIVGAIAATGGTAKTFLVLQLGCASTHGEPFGPIAFPRKLRALIVCAEDDQAEVNRRLWRIAEGRFAGGLHVAAIPGSIGPLMELDPAGNPRKSKFFGWLDGELSKYERTLDLLVLDPFSRFYGLGENSNEHATAFVSALETLRERHNLTILVTAHTNQDSSANPPDRMDKSMLRGASGLADGVRWVLGLRHMTQKVAKQLCIEDRFGWVEMDLVKTNYTARPPRPFYLKKNTDGTLDPGNPAAGRIEAMAKALVEVLGDAPLQFTVRDLEKNEAGRAVESRVREIAPGFSRRQDTRRCIDYAAGRGWLEVVSVSGSQGSPAQKIAILTTAQADSL